MTAADAPAPAPSAGTEAKVAVSCHGLSRSFGNTHALTDIDLDVAAGGVHALVGENGAGKSTCLGIIAGRIAPTSGEVSVFGQTPRYGHPRSAQRLGVAAVYQELTVIPQLTPQENAFLYRPVGKLGWIPARELRRRYVAACDGLGIPAAPDVPAGELTVASQQLIEIVRAVTADARLVLLDEPTAALSVSERDALFRLVAQLRERGVTFVLVSHNLEEVLANTDEVTVFREGKLVTGRASSGWTKAELVKSMLGAGAAQELVNAGIEGSSAEDGEAEAGAGPAASAAPEAELGEVVLEAGAVSIPGRLENVELQVREGEVLGIAGLVGAGRSSLLRALAGAEPRSTGRLRIGGREVRWPRNPAKARKLGIGFIPEDRKTEGLILGMSAADNVAVPSFRKVARFGYLSPRRLIRRVTPLLDAAAVQTSRARSTSRTLSGGNQQKLLFARAYYEEPRILLCDEPTRGVDIGAKTDLLHQIRRLAREQRLAVILVSSELEEVIGFSDRVMVLAGGQVRAVLDSREGPLQELDLLNAAFSVDPEGNR